MGIGNNLMDGLKNSFNKPTSRREEKNQRAYTISQTEIEQKLQLKGKIVWVNFDKGKGIVKITTEE